MSLYYILELMVGDISKDLPSVFVNAKFASTEQMRSIERDYFWDYLGQIDTWLQRRGTPGLGDSIGVVAQLLDTPEKVDLVFGTDGSLSFDGPRAGWIRATQ